MGDGESSGKQCSLKLPPPPPGLEEYDGGNGDNTYGGGDYNYEGYNFDYDGDDSGNQSGNDYNQGNNDNYNQGGYNSGFGYNQGGQNSSGSYQVYEGDYASKKRRIIEDVYRLLVSATLVRQIIGRGGSTIKAMKQAVGPECKISIYAQGTNNTSIPPGAHDRVMSIQCPITSLHKVLHELIPLLQIDPRAKEKEIKCMVPSHSCIAVVGQQGANVKQINEETGCTVNVHNNPLPYSDEHVVKVQNTELEPLVNGAVRVFESILDIKGAHPTTFYDPQVWNRGDFGDTGSYIETQPPPIYSHSYHGYDTGFAAYNQFQYEYGSTQTGFYDPNYGYAGSMTYKAPTQDTYSATPNYYDPNYGYAGSMSYKPPSQDTYSATPTYYDPSAANYTNDPNYNVSYPNY